MLNKRKEQRLRLLARRKQEQIQQEGLREDRELAEVAKAQRLAREGEDARRKRAKSRFELQEAARQKLAAAKEHSLKSTMLYHGWVPWVKRVKKAQLQDIKAQRHYQYCVMHNVWGLWKLAIARARSTKINQVYINNLKRRTKFREGLREALSILLTTAPKADVAINSLQKPSHHIFCNQSSIITESRRMYLRFATRCTVVYLKHFLEARSVWVTTAPRM